MELAGLEIFLLIFVALLAGAINTVAGGGSNLVIPALMIMGMPPEVANATNRVGIFVESVVAVSEFKRHDRLETLDLRAILVPMAIGGLVVGIVMAVATYYPSLWAVRFYQKRRRDKLNRAQAGIDNEASGHE